MRRVLFFLFIPAVTYGQNCRDVSEGVFKMHGLYGSLHTIIRENEKQTEIWGRWGAIVQYDVQWLSDCMFMLLNQKLIRGHDSLLHYDEKDTIYNEIKEINKYWHHVESTVNDSDKSIGINYFNVDTIQLYQNIDITEKGNEFAGKSGGGTFIGYNYVVTYRQHSEDSLRFRIAFMEALIFDNNSKYKLLDEIYCTLDTTQKIAISGCRFNDQYDKEIIAVYCSNDPDTESHIIKAWRLNKQRFKIEEVPVERVKYKEADKKLPVWYN